MSKDQWIIAVERIGDRLMEGEITREEAITAWMRMGLDRDLAEWEADEAEGKI